MHSVNVQGTWAASCLPHSGALLRPEDEVCNIVRFLRPFLLYCATLIFYKGIQGFRIPMICLNRMIHIGKLIEEELRRQERSVAWLARKLFCQRQNIYDIFKRESIDTTLLKRISSVLGHDFFRDLSDDMANKE